VKGRAVDAIPLDEALAGKTMMITTANGGEIDFRIASVQPHVPDLGLDNNPAGVRLTANIMRSSAGNFAPEQECRLFFLRHDESFKVQSPGWFEVNASDEFVAEEVREGFWAVLMTQGELWKLQIKTLTLSA
jgi:hypothetical protein